MIYVWDTESNCVYESDDSDDVCKFLECSKPTLYKHAKQGTIIKREYYVSYAKPMRVRRMRIDPVYIYNYEGELLTIATSMETLFVRVTSHYQRKSLKEFVKGDSEFLELVNYRYYKKVPHYVQNLSRRYTIYDKDNYVIGYCRTVKEIGERFNMSPQLVVYHIKNDTGIIKEGSDIL